MEGENTARWEGSQGFQRLTNWPEPISFPLIKTAPQSRNPWRQDVERWLIGRRPRRRQAHPRVHVFGFCRKKNWKREWSLKARILLGVLSHSKRYVAQIVPCLGDAWTAIPDLVPCGWFLIMYSCFFFLTQLTLCILLPLGVPKLAFNETPTLVTALVLQILHESQEPLGHGETGTLHFKVKVNVIYGLLLFFITPGEISWWVWLSFSYFVLQ